MNHRRRLFIDRPVQIAVMRRALYYVTICTCAQLLVVTLFAFATSTQRDYADGMPHLWWYLQVSLLASIVLIPIVLLDVLKLSHRWVGPIYRLRSSLQGLGRGESIAPVQFRAGDFWQELAEDLNAVTAQLDRYKDKPQEKTTVATLTDAIVLPNRAKKSDDKSSVFVP
jgi:hypothetical protein